MGGGLHRVHAATRIRADGRAPAVTSTSSRQLALEVNLETIGPAV
jgi:hypothetical protein